MRVGQLLRGKTPALEVGVAGKVGERIGELCLIAIAICDHLIALCLIRARINLREQISRLDRLPLDKGNLGELPLNLAPNDNGIVGNDRADALQIDGDFVAVYAASNDGHRRHRNRRHSNLVE